ncbi:Receptor-like serine/threonine-protein kinase [Citrus sinensis]|nr:Receptor-like serine/threonine-protein kinase [Citrus sinensis]
MLLLGSSDSTLTDKLVQGQLLKDGMLLVSAFGNFKLGFFSPASSTTTERYLGIWHDTAPDTLGWYFRPILPRYQTDEPIWIENRNTPILDQSGVLTIDSIDGNLKILHNGGNPIAVSSVEGASNNTSATLLQSGNLVLREMNTDGTIKRVLWQSFDYPTDTLLPGMKLGINLQTGHQWFLQSWLDYSSPAQGSFTLGIEPNATNQLIIRWRRETIYWTSGLLLNGNFNFSRSWNLSFSYTSNEQEKYFEYSLNEGVTSSVFLRIDPEGALSDSRGSFAPCTYGGCWNQLPRPICRKGTGPENFQSKFGLISEHGFKFKESDNMSSTDCRAKCFYNCSCIAFATGTRGFKNKQAYCEIWSEGTEFTEIASNNSREIFILAIKGFVPIPEEKWWRSLTIAIGVVLGIPMLCYLCYVTWRKLKAKVENKMNQMKLLRELGDNVSLLPTYGKRKSPEKDQSISHELKIFDFQTIAAAANNFSTTNKLGEGGFGPVYKVDSGRKNVLNWEKRFIIIEGISQGLLYLHKYSRLRVIHRDLKASNILLDDKMNPKISDFGMARIFEVNESEANTKRIVGTYGYMSPEYAMSGIVSIKTDVFSFGVLVLEIVSGQKNHTRHHPDRPLNLIGYAWQLLSDGKGLELIDPSLEQPCSANEVMRCIHVGLLCVQDQAMDRPTMPEVVCMLQNETVPLPPPKQPAFFINANADDQVPEVPDNEVAKFSTNDVTMTTMEAR